MPERSDRLPPTADALRDELTRTRRDNARLRDELARVERDRARLERERAQMARQQDRLRRENERLKDELDAARRAGARQAAPTDEALCRTIRGSPMVSPDETGWRVNGRLHWLWAFATPDTTVSAIHAGRGFPEAAATLGADFGGVLVRDGWAPYRQFTRAGHQTCLAHLLRRCRLLIGDHPHARLPAAVHTILREALALRDRHRAGTVSPHGVASARGRLIVRLGAVVAVLLHHQTRTASAALQLPPQ